MAYVQRIPAFHLPRFSPVLPLIVALHIALICVLNSEVTINRPHVPADLIAVFLPVVHEKPPESLLQAKPVAGQRTPSRSKDTPIPDPIPVMPLEDANEHPIVQLHEYADLPVQSVQRLAPRIDPRHPIGRPDYPSASVRLNEAGVVRLSVCVAADGRIADATVQASSRYPRLDQAAVAHLRRPGMRMMPGTENDRAVPMCTDLAIRFELQR